MRRCVCPGSFDPVTNGHLDVVERAANLFDEVAVLVTINNSKQSLFTVDERIEMLRECTADLDNVRVDSFHGLLVDYCREHDVHAIVKGLRAVSDFDYELQMAQMNHRLSEVDTVFVPTSPESSYLSSSLVKEVATWGGDVSGLVPPAVLTRLESRVGAYPRSRLGTGQEGRPVDVHDKLDELAKVVGDARAMPMSASCIVNRGELLGLVEEMRELLPEEFRHAQLLLGDREAVVEEGRREANRIIVDAEQERDRLTSQTEVMAAARARAEEMRVAALDEAQRMRDEVDDYVDTKLANFEVVLDKTMVAVHRGRDKLRGRAAHDHFAGPEDDFSHPLDTHHADEPPYPGI